MKFTKLGHWLDDTLNRDCAEEWDNVGWMVRPSNSTVTGISLSVDPSPGALESAIEENNNVLITHHPLIFDSLDQLVEDNPTQRTLIRACREDVGIYAAHTNADSMVGGLNDHLADVLDMTNRRPIRPLEDREQAGLGRIGTLESPRTIRELQTRLEEALDPTILEIVGGTDREISDVALCSGSGGDFIDGSLADAADLYITADLKHHDVQKARSYDLPLIILDHGEMESVFTRIVRERLEDDLEETLPVHTYQPDSPYQRTLPTT
jgi:dinuclear metal center YbgI/SA1388 family protein